MNRVIKLSLTTAAIASLSACGQPEAIVLTPPASLLTCADEPGAPDLPTQEYQKQRDVLTLDYILALRSAFGSCKSQLAGVKAWSDSVSE